MARFVVATLATFLMVTGAEESPPVVEFHGKAPKLRIYPGGNTANDTWMMLTFGKIQELDPRGRKVPGRAIPNLAAEERGIVWSQENRSIGGAPAVVTSMELPLSYGGRFRERCKRRGGRKDRLLAEAVDTDTDTTGSLTIEVFVFQSDALVDYGDFQIEVQRGQMKFNVEAVDWPFCGLDHQLEVNMNVKVKGDKPPKRVKEEPEEEQEEEEEAGGGNLNLDIHTQRKKGDKGEKDDKKGGDKKGGDKKGGDKKGGDKTRKPRRRPKRKAMRQSAGKRDIDFNFPEAVLADNVSAACEVIVQSTRKKTNIAFRFPYFEDNMVYDPTAGFVDPDANEEEEAMMTKTVVSGSVKLSAEDPVAFCNNEKVIVGLTKAIARASKQEASAVKLTCAPSEGRRLAAMQSVEIKYDITVPEDAPEASGAEAAAAAITELSAEQLKTIVNEELATAGADVTVEVTEQAVASAETVFYTTTTTSPPTTTMTEKLASGVTRAGASSAMAALGLAMILAAARLL